MTDEQRNQIVGFGCLAVLVCIVLLLYYTLSDNPSAPQELDSTGYISHRVESTITADASWMVGESRTCISNPLDSLDARAIGKPVGYALWGLQCGGEDWHRINVTFWGSEVQTGKKAAYWNCKRTADAFICKQTEAY